MNLIEIKRAFKSNINSIEIILLLNDAKPCIRQGYYENEINDILTFCKKNKLFIEKSNFKIELDKNKFSNIGIISEEGLNFYYISKNKNIAKKAKEYEENRDDKSLGELLGYPNCCIDFFIQNKKNALNYENDFLFLIAKKGNYPFQNNIANRYFDASILSHFPCNFNCRESVKIANNYLDVIKKTNEELYLNLVYSLVGDIYIKDLEIFTKINNKIVSSKKSKEIPIDAIKISFQLNF